MNLLGEGEVDGAYAFAMDILAKKNVRAMQIIRDEMEDVPDYVREQVKEIVVYTLCKSICSSRRVARQLLRDVAYHGSFLAPKDSEEICEAVSKIANSLAAVSKHYTKKTKRPILITSSQAPGSPKY